MVTVGNVICVIATALLSFLPTENHWGRLVSFWWVTQLFIPEGRRSLHPEPSADPATLLRFVNVQSIGFTLGLVMISSNIGGFSKRSITSAMVFAACTSLPAARPARKARADPLLTSFRLRGQHGRSPVHLRRREASLPVRCLRHECVTLSSRGSRLLESVLTRSPLSLLCSGRLHRQARCSLRPLGHHVLLEQVARPQVWPGRPQAGRGCRHGGQDRVGQVEPVRLSSFFYSFACQSCMLTCPLTRRNFRYVL